MGAESLTGRRTSMKELFRSLGILLGYFHEDWPDISEDIDSAVNEFKDVYPQEIEGAISDINGILDSPYTDQELLRFFLECGSALDPNQGHGSPRAWLEVLKGVLERRSD